MSSLSQRIQLFFLILTLSTPTFADVLFLPRTQEELIGRIFIDPMIAVAQAKVAYFNRNALERDFPFLKHQSRAAIEKWILDNCAYISNTQIEFNTLLQTPVPTFPKGTPHRTKLGYRPRTWNRAAVIPVQDFEFNSAGLVDLKGAGLSKILGPIHVEEMRDSFALALAEGDSAKKSAALNRLRTLDHANGLSSLGEAIAEVVRAEALQRSFNHFNELHGTDFQTVEHYFIIALPFSILKEDGHLDSAGLIGRQAHVGREAGLTHTGNELYVDILGGKQSDALGAAVDMGAVFPTDPGLAEHFLYPHQIQSLPFLPAYTPQEAGRIFDPQESKAWRFAHDTATAFMEGPHNRDGVATHLEDMMGAYRDQEPVDPLPRTWTRWVERDVRWSEELSKLVWRELQKTYLWDQDKVFDLLFHPNVTVKNRMIDILSIHSAELVQEIPSQLVPLWIQVLEQVYENPTSSRFVLEKLEKLIKALLPKGGVDPKAEMPLAALINQKVKNLLPRLEDEFENREAILLFISKHLPTDPTIRSELEIQLEAILSQKGRGPAEILAYAVLNQLKILP